MAGIPVLVTVLALIVVGCSSSGTPATTPPSAPTPASTIVIATTTLPPMTTTTAVTTTTVDRVTEIEAIFQDLEERRLQALYEGDKETFKSLFANQEYLTRSLALFDLVEFVEDWQLPSLAVVDVLADREECIAVRVEWDLSQTFVGANPADGVEVIELVSDTWGISYSGEGWTCEGPHPFSP